MKGIGQTRELRGSNEENPKRSAVHFGKACRPLSNVTGREFREKLLGEKRGTLMGDNPSSGS